MDTVTRRSWRKRTSAAAIVLLGGALSGCSSRSEVVLHQPFAPPSQQEMTLRTGQAVSAAAGGRWNCALDFPLPGSAAGPCEFHVYVTLPSAEGEYAIAPDDPHGARGFLIQDVGLLCGKTEFTSGTVRCHPVFLRPHLRRLDLQVQCADGTSVSGQVRVEIDERALRKFERDFARDIAELWSDETPPGKAAGSTARGVHAAWPGVCRTL